jgi:hypothetical protein
LPILDNILVNLTHYSYLEEGAKTGVRFYRHGPGFMHQKVMLIDDETAAVGTANFDNRSMRLNFEVTVLCIDREFAGEVGGCWKRIFATAVPPRPRITPAALCLSDSPYAQCACWLRCSEEELKVFFCLSVRG